MTDELEPEVAQWGQLFGFNQADVDALRTEASRIIQAAHEGLHADEDSFFFAARAGFQLRDLAGRIEALLPTPGQLPVMSPTEDKLPLPSADYPTQPYWVGPEGERPYRPVWRTLEEWDAVKRPAYVFGIEMPYRLEISPYRTREWRLSWYEGVRWFLQDRLYDIRLWLEERRRTDW